MKVELQITAAKALPSLRLFAIPSPLSCVVGGGGASGKCKLFPNTLYKGITIQTSTEKSVTIDLIGVLSVYPLMYSYIHTSTSSHPQLCTCTHTDTIHFFAEQSVNDRVVHPHTHKPTSTHTIILNQVMLIQNLLSTHTHTHTHTHTRSEFHGSP